jgi:hypothetical protein
MENTTQFNLNASLQQWSEDLVAQPGLTPEVRSELQTHLQETVKDLCKRGLNEQESFWLACRRVGQPRQLAEEFVKANPWPMWKRYALWVVTAMLGMRIFQGIFAWVSGSLTFFELHAAVTPWWVQGLRDAFLDTGVGDVIGALAVICGAVLIARSPDVTSSRLWRLFFQTRSRFVMIGTSAVLTIFALELWSETVTQAWRRAHPEDWALFFNTSPNSFFKLIFPSALVILIAWLIPSDSDTKSAIVSWPVKEN